MQRFQTASVASRLRRRQLTPRPAAPPPKAGSDKLFGKYDELMRLVLGFLLTGVLGAYLSQLVMDGDATLGDDGLFISWGTVFELLKSSEHSGAVDYLGLPAVGSLKPILTHDSSLSHPDFEVRIDGWVDAQGTVRVDRRVGAVAQLDGQEVLLGEYAWRLADELSRFSARSRDFRTQHENELGWGRLRALANEAGAFYASPYLETTIVLTPQSLRLPLS